MSVGDGTAVEASAEQHFDEIAARYDFWKQKNWYYYRNLIALYRAEVPRGASVLEIGCGTGDILAALEPSRGLGIDVSAGMVAIAARKHGGKPALRFEQHDIFRSDAPFDADWVVCADVLEHVPDLPAFLRQTGRRVRPGSRLVVSVANPLWEPALMLAEKLGMKMPEGPHERIGIGATERLFGAAGLKLLRREFRLLVPKPLPLADRINRGFAGIPGLRRLGFVVYWVLEPAALRG